MRRFFQNTAGRWVPRLWVSRLWAAGLLALLAGPSALADVVQLEGGESLSGDFARITNGTLVFRTSLSGQIMVPMDAVRTLHTEQNLYIATWDKQVVYGRLGGAPGAPWVAPINGGPPRPIDLAQIEEALPIPSAPKTVPAGAGPGAWTAVAGVGVQHRTGSRGRTEVFTRLEIAHSNARRNLKAELTVGQDYSDAGPGLLRSRAEVSRRGGSSIQPYGAVEAERNIDAALELRTGLTLGLGKALFGEEEEGLEGRIGFNFAYENWDRANLRGARGRTPPGAARRKDGGEISLQLGLQYHRALFGKASFREQLLFYPSLTDWGAMRTRSEAAVTVPVTERLRVRLDFAVDFDSEPEFRGVEAWNTSLGASIELNF